MSKCSVVLENLSKVYDDPQKGKLRVVDNISLTVPQGQLMTLLGPSGCGKTTTLKMIGGFETPTSGEIYFDKTVVSSIPPNLREAAMVFQSYALFPHMSVFHNIIYGLTIRKLSKVEITNKVGPMMEKVGLTEMANRLPGELSGGQQQRVALARALVVEPKVLLLDEPLSNLDAKLRVQMRQEIREMQRDLGITSVYVTHDQEEAMSVSDKIIIMNQGHIEQIGSPQEIYRTPASRFVANFIGQANFIQATVEEMQQDKIIVKTKNSVLEVSSGASVNKGDTGWVVVRPEAIDIVDASKSDLKGKIGYTTYLGAKVVYEIEVHGDSLSVDIVNPDPKTIHAPGSEVGIKFSSSSLCFVTQ